MSNSSFRNPSAAFIDRTPPQSAESGNVEFQRRCESGVTPESSEVRPTAGSESLRAVASSVNGLPGNRLIRGDLRIVLPSIAHESVDFAYLDPPFMTQKNFGFNSAAYARHRLRLTGCEENPDESQRALKGYRDQWSVEDYVEFLGAAISLIRPLLKPTGLIAVHTDFRASHYVRMLLDEHFGSDRIVNELIWKYGLGNAKSTRHFLKKHDNIAVYAAGAMEHYYFKQLRGKVTPAQNAKYCHEDERGRYMLSYGRKYYMKGGKPLESVLEIPSLGARDRERTGYPTQKPVRLLKVLVEAFCPPGGLVLDPCCGCGTTAVAASELGCRWIAIDANDGAIQIAYDRLVGAVRVSDPGFRVERIDNSADAFQVGGYRTGISGLTALNCVVTRDGCGYPTPP